MSKCRGLGAQRFIQAQAGFVSVAALLCLSAPAKLLAQTAPEQPSPPERSAQETLPPVDVEVRRRPPPRRPAVATPAPAPTPPQQATTEALPAVTGYRANTSGIGRLPVPLRDTPQTINVVPQQVIQEQRANTMEDALRAIPGITFSAGEGGQQGDGPIIRGFVARTDLFRDGMRDPGWYTRDLFAADRVEVYKGPSAFAFGRGATGGAINTVSKLPDGKSFVEGTVTATTGPGIRTELDAGGKNGIWSGRIAALGMDLDTPTRDNVWTRRWGVAPSVSVDLGERTKATFSYIYQGEQGAPDYGFTYLPQPAYSPLTGALTNPGYYGNGAATPPLPVPRNTWYGIPTGPLRDITEVNTQVATAKIEHELNNNTKFTNAIRYIVNERYSLPTSPRAVGDATGALGNPPPANFPVDQMFLGRERRERQTNNTYLVNQGDVVTKFNTEAWQHTLAAGYEITGETREQSRRDLCDPANVACRTSVVEPDGIGAPSAGAPVVFKEINTRASNLAMFASDQIKTNKYFELLASVRGDFFRTVYDDPNQAVVANQHLERSDSMVSYRFGAVGHPMSNVSTYVAYGISYNPSAELGTITNLSTANLAPERTFTIESGVKADLLNNQLSLTAAVFRIEKTNLRINDPTNSTVTILDGVARVDGVEFGAAGKITDAWSVFGGYSYLQSRTTDLSIRGRELPNTPSHNLTLWTTYALTGKLTLGGGATYQSAAFANTGNTAFVPDYWKFDAMLSYKVDDKSTLQLNVYNLTDKLYYSQYFGSNVVPASGRWAALTYKVRW
jgi:catecholate siderophore receptor